MPSKKKKYNARFPAGRIKKIMQTDEEVGKVAQAVPVIISRTLELFVESLLTKSMQITQSRNAKTLTPSHMKQCILSESRFDFLKDLVKNIPDASAQEDNENNAAELAEHSDEPRPPQNLFTEQSTSARTPVIQYGPRVVQVDQSRLNFAVDRKVVKVDLNNVPPLIPSSQSLSVVSSANVDEKVPQIVDDVPQLIPISHNFYSQNTGDSLYIDEDYDN